MKGELSQEEKLTHWFKPLAAPPTGILMLLLVFYYFPTTEKPCGGFA